MDFLEGFLKEQGPALIQSLISQAGFDAGQAESFLPAAVSAVSQLFQGDGGGLDLGSLLGGAGDLSSLTQQLDTASLASQVGIDEAKASAGLDTILPTLMSSLGSQGGGLEGALGALAGGDAGKMLGGLGKLFGK